MNLPRWYSQSDYMEFSKLRSTARFNLATSGIVSCSLSDLNISFDSLELNRFSAYGHRPLLDAIAHMKGVSPESIVLAAGTSMANHLAMSALFAPGDEVLVEEPAYEPMLTTALYLGAKVSRFQRRFEDGFALDPAEVARHLTPQTRLIVLTNMHNPSGVLADENSLREVGALAAEAGARVLVDEVYLELLHQPPAPTSYLFGNEFVVTSSLTKAYGLSGLRCGWILAEPTLTERVWRLNDLFSGAPVSIADQISVVAIEQSEKLARRSDAILAANRSAFAETLGSHPAIEFVFSATGTTVFPRLRQGDAPEFCSFLREHYETSVVPGSYFERPQHFRVGLSGDVEMTREGLARVSHALDRFSASR